MPSSYHSADIEKDAAGADYGHLMNDTVKSFSWENVTVTVKDRASKQPLDILSSVNGFVEAGELLALMGPRYVITHSFPMYRVWTDVVFSGSGKTTLLNVLAHRAAVANSTVQQDMRINGAPTHLNSFRKLSCYVEQEDALVGSLTVRETLYFAAQLGLPR
jgi:ABC-type multidrug transport system ATPase subunit